MHVFDAEDGVAPFREKKDIKLKSRLQLLGKIFRKQKHGHIYIYA
jgi:hypothetical protein